MDVQQKLPILADAAKYDASCHSGGANTIRAGSELGSTPRTGICHSFTPDGRCVSLLKILLANHCIYDCRYCINRVSSDTPRARFTVEEVVQLTLEFYKRNYIEGLFLSSGVIKNADYTMEQLCSVARQLREQHRFGGYIHLKTIPGAATELVIEAGRYADRVSVNIELPTARDLQQLAPEKRHDQIVEAMDTFTERIQESQADQKAGFQAPQFAPAGQSTQMIIGATPTEDLHVLQTANGLYQQQKLQRVYYSAYSPIPDADARLPGQSPPLLREHRLYQADWLMRFYGFKVDEIVSADQPNLDLHLDPKLSWALRHREFFPVDVNRAAREQLLRVPGMGARNVNRILAIRRYRQLRSADLKKLRVAWRRTAPFVITADHNPALRALDSTALVKQTQIRDRQLSLFDAASSARTGEI